MAPEIPAELLRRAAEWVALHRWERAELGRDLRRLGLTYGEIRSFIPVPKGTLAGWCADVELTKEQIDAIKARSTSQLGVPRDTQWRRRLEVEAIRSEARAFAREHLDDPFFVAGVVLYWAEGSKTHGRLALANSDPAALRFFIAWVCGYLDTEARFRLALHLHEGNDDLAAQSHWRSELELPHATFTKTFIKPSGTGHRKNHLKHGICRVTVRRSTDAWYRVMAWIEVIRGSSWSVGPPA